MTDSTPVRLDLRMKSLKQQPSIEPIYLDANGPPVVIVRIEPPEEVGAPATMRITLAGMPLDDGLGVAVDSAAELLADTVSVLAGNRSAIVDHLQAMEDQIPEPVRDTEDDKR